MNNPLFALQWLNLAVLTPILASSSLLNFALFAAQIQPVLANESNASILSEPLPITVVSAPASESPPKPQTALTGQVTSVSQLSDVQPTDWAFSALQSLVERYGCIAGYPDGTYRGNRALTRYEFAAGVNACLDQINQLIAAGTENFAKREDLIVLQRLQEEFAAELATLRGRVDVLEARASELEANQFSTTTKLSMLMGFNLTGATAGSRVKVERIDPNDSLSAAGRDANGRPIVTEVKDDPNSTFSHFSVITFNTSFNGQDKLVTSLAVGNGDSPANQFASAGLYNTAGVPTFDITTAAGDNKVELLELYYSFPVNDALEVSVGPRLIWSLNFDQNAFTSLIGIGAGSYNSYGNGIFNDLSRGAGGIVLWQMNDQFKLNLGYMANVPGAADPTLGLFENTRSFTAELIYSPSKNANVRLIYDRSHLLPNDDGQIDSRPIKGVADDGFGGKLEWAKADTFGVNFDWRLSQNFGIFGRYTYNTTRLEPAGNGRGGRVNAQAFQFGLGFPDLGKEGAMGALSVVIPYDILSGRQFLVSGGGDGGIQYDIEATYYFPMTDHVALVPSFYLIKNANNFSSNPTIYVGSLRMQFSF